MLLARCAAFLLISSAYSAFAMYSGSYEESALYRSLSVGIFSGLGSLKYSSYMSLKQLSIIPLSSDSRPYFASTMHSHIVSTNTDFVFKASLSFSNLESISRGLRWSGELVASFTTVPPKDSTRGKYSPSGSQMMISSSVLVNTLYISLFAAKDFPEPGIPMMSPLGFSSCFLSAKIRFLVYLLRP